VRKRVCVHVCVRVCMCTRARMRVPERARTCAWANTYGQILHSGLKAHVHMSTRPRKTHTQRRSQTYTRTHAHTRAHMRPRAPCKPGCDRILGTVPFPPLLLLTGLGRDGGGGRQRDRGPFTAWSSYTGHAPHAACVRVLGALGGQPGRLRARPPRVQPGRRGCCRQRPPATRGSTIYPCAGCLASLWKAPFLNLLGVLACPSLAGCLALNPMFKTRQPSSLVFNI